MKKLFKYMFIILGFIILFSINSNVFASGTYNSTLSVSTQEVQPGTTFSVTLSLSGLPSGGLGGVTYNISYDSSLVEYVSNSNSSFIVTNNSGSVQLLFIDYTGSSPLTTGTTLTFKAKTDGTANFSLTSEGEILANGDSITSTNKGTSISIRSLSTDANLKELYSSDIDLDFDPNKVQYSVETTLSQVTIYATPPDRGRLSSNGGSTKIVKKLSYGTNIVEIRSTSESNIEKVYTITISRIDTRESDASLSSIDGVSNFDKDKYTYDITIPTNQGAFTVSAKAAKSKSTISYSQDTTLLLNYGETKSIQITVTAENGNTKTYTLNVTREDNRSTNAYLKNITVDQGSITFAKDNFSYRIVVDNDVTEINITATAEDSRSSIDGAGNKPLAIGSNLFRVTCTAENGDKKIYTFVIIRKDKNNDASKLSRNTNVTKLTLNGEEIKLQANIYTYAISVENSVSTASFHCDLEDEKAMALLEGDVNLKVGVNKFKITVTAENGNNVVYDIVVERQELRKVVSNDKEEILTAINTGTDSVITVTVPYNDLNRQVDTEILTALKTTNKTLIYEVLNENRGLNYSVTIIGTELTNIDTFDFNITFDSENKEAIDLLSNAKKTVYIDLKENTNLQGKIKMKVYVGDKFDATNTLTLYYYDKTNNKLELITKDLKVTNSYVEIDIDKFAEYILIDESQIKKSSTNNSSANLSGSEAILLGIIPVIVIIIIVVVIILKKKKRVKIPKKVETNNTETTNDNNETNNTGNQE